MISCIINSNYLTCIFLCSWNRQVVGDKRTHLYWTCVAHYLNLIFEDIFKMSKLKRTLAKIIQLNGYIYNCPMLLNMTRHFTKQRESLRPTKTHFATAFIIALYSWPKDNLRKMFTWANWMNSKWTKEALGKKCATYIV